MAKVGNGNSRGEPSWRGLYRVSGVLAVISGIGGFVSMLGGADLYKSGYPSTAAAYLQLVSQHQALANGLWSIFFFGDFVMIAPTVAAYLILRHYNRTMALVGSLIVGLHIFFDISVTELNSLTLVSLSQGYANATTDAARATFVAAATYGYTALPLQTVLSFGVGPWDGSYGVCPWRRASSVDGLQSSVPSSTSSELSARRLPWSRQPSLPGSSSLLRRSSAYGSSSSASSSTVTAVNSPTWTTRLIPLSRKTGIER